ncbi:MAG: integration host factor subunit alpha [Thermodesulfobacteriota bacterium]
MTLTKADLAHRIFDSHEAISKGQAVAAVEMLLEAMKGCLEKGDDLLISGFGKFRVRGKRARRGRNPQTGEELMLTSRNVVTFRPSGILRDRLNSEQP